MLAAVIVPSNVCPRAIHGVFDQEMIIQIGEDFFVLQYAEGNIAPTPRAKFAEGSMDVSRILRACLGRASHGPHFSRKTEVADQAVMG